MIGTSQPISNTWATGRYDMEQRSSNSVWNIHPILNFCIGSIRQNSWWYSREKIYSGYKHTISALCETAWLLLEHLVTKTENSFKITHHVWNPREHGNGAKSKWPNLQRGWLVNSMLGVKTFGGDIGSNFHWESAALLRRADTCHLLFYIQITRNWL